MSFHIRSIAAAGLLATTAVLGFAGDSRAQGVVIGNPYGANITVGNPYRGAGMTGYGWGGRNYYAPGTVYNRGYIAPGYQPYGYAPTRYVVPNGGYVPTRYVAPYRGGWQSGYRAGGWGRRMLRW